MGRRWSDPCSVGGVPPFGVWGEGGLPPRRGMVTVVTPAVGHGPDDGGHPSVPVACWAGGARSHLMLTQLYIQKGWWSPFEVWAG